MVCHNVNDITKMFCEMSDNINYCMVDLHVYKVSCMQINLASVYVSIDCTVIEFSFIHFEQMLMCISQMLLSTCQIANIFK